MRRDGISVQSTKSNQLDIVTHADTTVEALIRQRLKSTRPDDGFLGEESGPDQGTSGITWVVDPIDGTVNYLYGSPYYATSIAATVLEPDGLRTAIAGCVYAPALNAEYTAAIGQPALLNNTKIVVNEDVPLDRALVSTSFTYDVANRERQTPTVSALASRIRDFRLTGAAALDICAVAEGRVDAHFAGGLPIWDYAAAALIATQAGAVVGGGANDAPPSSNLVLVANAQLADALYPFIC
jgi:myo-inositol-1(or 4)-monophosphatase